MSLSKEDSSFADKNGKPLLGARQDNVAVAKVNYTTGDLDTEAEIIAAVNTTNGKINSILSILVAHGLMESA